MRGGPGEAPLPPEWFDGYTDEDLNVLVAHVSQLDAEALWSSEPADFNGAWRIDLAEGVDDVLGSGSIEQLIEHLRMTPDVEAAALGGEDMLVVRAPQLSSGGLREIVLTWLNSRWADEKDRRTAS